MIQSLSRQITGSLILTLLIINTIATAIQLFPLAFIKFIIPLSWWRAITGKILIKVANNWVFINKKVIETVFPIEWIVTGAESLQGDDWYLVISNHQSWVDIFILQSVLYGKIPYIKFFLKKELIWIPIMGLAWWALDFPFMKRYTKKEIEAKPHLKGKDIEITRKACEKFKSIPVTIMTFTEGTRFTEEKHTQQKSPYKHLLKPKAGGVSFTISAMGDRLHKLLDTTIVYPDGPVTIWEFLCGKLKKINVHIESRIIPADFKNADLEDDTFKKTFSSWLNDLWKTKDKKIDTIKEK